MHLLKSICVPGQDRFLNRWSGVRLPPGLPTLRTQCLALSQFSVTAPHPFEGAKILHNNLQDQERLFLGARGTSEKSH